MELLEKVKRNLILEHDEDDELLENHITAAISYAESYQHLPEGIYKKKNATYNGAGSYYAFIPLL